MIIITIRSGIKGVLWKASRIGERLSPYIGNTNTINTITINTNINIRWIMYNNGCLGYIKIINNINTITINNNTTTTTTTITMNANVTS